MEPNDLEQLWNVQNEQVVRAWQSGQNVATAERSCFQQIGEQVSVNGEKRGEVSAKRDNPISAQTHRSVLSLRDHHVPEESEYENFIDVYGSK